jgi:hypothetical protein
MMPSLVSRSLSRYEVEGGPFVFVDRGLKSVVYEKSEHCIDGWRILRPLALHGFQTQQSEHCIIDSRH